MARSALAVVRLSDLRVGMPADCFALLAERARTVTQSGKMFFSCRFRDARKSLNSVIWSDAPLFAACESEWLVGRFYKLRVSLTESEKYGEQLVVHQIRPATDEDRPTGFDPADLVDRSRFDSQQLFDQLRQLVQDQLRDPPLRTLILGLLDQHAAALKALPGSLRHYYPFAGGWLEHTLNVSRNCLSLGDCYVEHYPDAQPPLNRDLLLAGAVLHDIGRLLEIDEPLSTEPSVRGRLLGHLVLGRDLVRDAARDVPELNPELSMLLEHLIVSHLTLPEWGSPRLPAIPECLILHHADDLDAKMEMFMRCLARDVSPGPFTDRDPILGKPLLKKREV